MLKKIILTTSLLVLSQLTYAENCPTVNEIKAHDLHGWQALTTDSASVLTAAEMIRFTSDVENFSLAEWMNDAPEGPAHCYYTNINKNDPHYLGVFLAKHNLIPEEKSASWHSVDSDIQLCHGDVTECGFVSK